MEEATFLAELSAFPAMRARTHRGCRHIQQCRQESSVSILAATTTSSDVPTSNTTVLNPSGPLSSIVIHVKALKCGEKSVSIAMGSTVSSLKLAVKEAFGVEESNQRLIFKGKPLQDKDDATAILCDGSKVMLTVKAGGVLLNEEKLSDKSKGPMEEEVDSKDIQKVSMSEFWSEFKAFFNIYVDETISERVIEQWRTNYEQRFNDVEYTEAVHLATYFQSLQS